jgi:hypothetical protein
MSSVPNEPPSRPTEADADALMRDLRRQLEAVKASLEEHRLQMHAAGLTGERDRAGAGGD